MFYFWCLHDFMRDKFFIWEAECVKNKAVDATQFINIKKSGCIGQF